MKPNRFSLIPGCEKKKKKKIINFCFKHENTARLWAISVLLSTMQSASDSQFSLRSGEGIQYSLQPRANDWLIDCLGGIKDDRHVGNLPHYYKRHNPEDCDLNLLAYLIKHHAMKIYWLSEGIAACIRNLGTRWR
jgi:hypothetical protein